MTKKPNKVDPKARQEHLKKTKELSEELRGMLMTKEDLHDGVVIDSLLSLLFTFVYLRSGRDMKTYNSAVDIIAKQLKVHYQKTIIRASKVLEEKDSAK